jgi:hypothetical protein
MARTAAQISKATAPHESNSGVAELTIEPITSPPWVANSPLAVFPITCQSSLARASAQACDHAHATTAQSRPSLQGDP